MRKSQPWLCYLCLLMLMPAITLFAQVPLPANERTTVYVISLQDQIDAPLARKIIGQLVEADRRKGRAVILEIDTPGGLVDAATKICREIDRVSQAGMPIYAYVTGHAWSAGALIALACDRIYMKEQCSIGSAQVKIHSPLFGMKDAGEKWMSAMRAEFRAYAERHNYPKALAEAMVDPAIEVREIHYRGERFFKTGEELVKMRNEWDADKIIDRGVVVASGKLANFTAKEARQYGFCKGIHQSRASLLKNSGLDQFAVKELKISAEDAVVEFLTSQWVRVLLITLGILGILIEIWTPGFGIPGILGITCFALFFLGGYLAETTAVWEILLFIVGLVLLALEIFVIPGFGVAGILGILCCFVGLLLSFQTFILPGSEEEVNIFTNNIFNLTLSIGLDVLALVILARFLPEAAPLRRLSITTVQKIEEGYSVAIPTFTRLAGQEGVVCSKLRPAGRAEIDGEAYDVVSQGDFIEVGEKIKVLEIRGNKIIVEKLET